MLMMRTICCFIGFLGFILIAIPAAGSEGSTGMEIHNLPSEDLYVHTDKDVYFAGDRLFFKVYLLSGSSRENELQSRVMYLSLAGADGAIVNKLELYFRDETAVGSVLIADTLKTGMYQLSAWTNTMLIAETPVFARQIVVLNRFDAEIRSFMMEHTAFPLEESAGGEEDTLEVVPGRLFLPSGSTKPPVAPEGFGSVGGQGLILRTDKDIYGNRELVSLQFEQSDALSEVASASISVSREESLLLNAPNARSLVAEPDRLPADYYRVPKRPYANRQPHMLILPENHGPVVSGRVVDSRTGDPVSETAVFLSAVDTLTNLKYSHTKADGSFFFLLDDYHQGKTLYISVYGDGRTLDTHRLVLREKFQPAPFTPLKIITHPHIHAYLEEALLVKRVQRAYRTEALGLTAIERGTAVSPPPVLYHTPTHTIRMANYLPLDNLLEIANEIVPNLRIREQGGRFIARMINSRSAVFFADAPIFFMNGVWVPDIDELAALSSDDISRIEVLSRPWLFGNLAFFGIASIFNQGDLHDIPVHSGARRIQGNPIPEVFAFDPLLHAGAEPSPANTPDFRETLFWDPEMALENGRLSDLTFSTGDLPGRYSIKVEGLTKSGMPFSQTNTITVE